MIFRRRLREPQAPLFFCGREGWVGGCLGGGNRASSGGSSHQERNRISNNSSFCEALNRTEATECFVVFRGRRKGKKKILLVEAVDIMENLESNLNSSRGAKAFGDVWKTLKFIRGDSGYVLLPLSPLTTKWGCPQFRQSNNSENARTYTYVCAYVFDHSRLQAIY